MVQIELRDLQKADFNKGFLTILAQLTTVGEISEEKFLERFEELSKSPDYKILVAEDVDQSKIVGTATLIVERKFIHDCGKVGHIEDVCVDSECRGQRLGKRLIQGLLEACEQMGAYKCILDCSEDNQAFYEKCGLSKKEIQMVKYFNKTESRL